MKSLYNKLIISTFALAALACSSEDDLIEDWIEVNAVETPAPGTSGDLDLSSYIAIGNSLTAGYADGALYTQGQENSFPNLLAGQFALVGGGDFNQPDINSENGYNRSVSDLGMGVIKGRFVLALDTNCDPDIDGSPGPVALDGELPTAYAGDKSTLNNFGVPGIVTAQLLTPLTGTPGDPVENALYTRFATDPGTSTILGDAVATDPTFFSLWIGNNDVLGYATSGGDGTLPITPSATLGAQFQMVVDALKADPGVVLSIPPVLLTPFFRAVSHDVIPMDESTASATNSAYAEYNGGLDLAVACGIITSDEAASRKINFEESSNNAVVIEDESLTNVVIPDDCMFNTSGMSIPLPNYRQATEDDLFVLSAASVIGTLANESDPTSVIGVGVPLEDKYVLIPAEQAEINQAVVDFNTEIDAIITAENAGNADIAFIDVTPTFYDLFGVSDGELGIEVDGVTLTPDFSPNGVFSTDGIHPNPRGNAIVANLIIDTINDRWNASIPKISVLEKLSVDFRLESPDCE